MTRDGSEQSHERVAVLVVAYYNLAVEMEFLKMKMEAKKIYSTAF
jgi:hypothetical protein